ncbi:putative ribonuclease H-like domain-containing protein [Tanacetum coccineum]
MVPRAVLMKYGLVSINNARQVNAAHTKTTVNAARPMSYLFKKAHSTVKRPIYKNTSFKNSNFNQRVNIVKDKNANTVRPKAVVNVVKGNNVNAVKASACWVWKPKTKVLDHVSKHNSASITLNKFDYIDAQGRSNGFSRHMTGNMSYLTDYEEIDGGYVAFGGNPKGGKITGKGTIKTGNLDFENVYFVRELKFNLFSVSQMCDKKNSVLFNDTECIVLSPNFKLIDESQVLLRVPRKNNMYSVDLKNIVPKGGLTCLFAKATSDESKLWHRRLGHLNFKTMNKLVKGNLVRGLPSKLFENDQTCVACQKGKQHRASCKSKTENSISLPLHLLHMDLFGPTFDKGKGILIEPVKPMNKKDLIRLDEETALNLQAEFDEKERLAREKVEKEEKANITLIETWDDIQAKIDADHQLAERMQAQEQEELSIEEKDTIFQQLLEKRRKHFAA